MSLFAEILTTVTLPVVILLGLGWVVQRRLALDISSLGRLLVNVVLPCALLNFLVNAELPLAQAWTTAWFTVVQFVAFTALGWGIAALCQVEKDIRPVVGLGLAFANTGNFGIPVAQLAFQPDFLLHQTVIVSLHSMMIIPAGVLILAGQRGSVWQALIALFTSPMILAVGLGLLLKAFEIDLPELVAYPVRLISGAYICLALFTLGAQLAETRFTFSLAPVWLLVALKMLLAPALTWAVLALIGVDPALTDLLVVAAAAPVGLLLAIFCTQYKRVPEIASAAVLVSTVLSPFLVTAWILAVRLY